MRIYKALNTETLHNKSFRMDSIIMELNNKVVLVCDNFRHSRKENLRLTIWLPWEGRWIRVYARNEYTEAMWDYYRKHQRKKRKCVDYEGMMRHNRVHKRGGGGGSRIYDGSITDYECTKNPLHDFRRCYN